MAAAVTIASTRPRLASQPGLCCLALNKRAGGTASPAPRRPQRGSMCHCQPSSKQPGKGGGGGGGRVSRDGGRRGSPATPAAHAAVVRPLVTAASAAPRARRAAGALVREAAGRRRPAPGRRTPAWWGAWQGDDARSLLRSKVLHFQKSAEQRLVHDAWRVRGARGGTAARRSTPTTPSCCWPPGVPGCSMPAAGLTPHTGGGQPALRTPI